MTTKIRQLRLAGWSCRRTVGPKSPSFNDHFDGYDAVGRQNATRFDAICRSCWNEQRYRAPSSSAYRLKLIAAHPTGTPNPSIDTVAAGGRGIRVTTQARSTPAIESPGDLWPARAPSPRE